MADEVPRITRDSEATSETPGTTVRYTKVQTDVSGQQLTSETIPGMSGGVSRNFVMSGKSSVMSGKSSGPVHVYEAGRLIQVKGNVGNVCTGDVCSGIMAVKYGANQRQKKQEDSYVASITFKAPNEGVFNALRTELEEMKRFSKVDFCFVNTVDSDLKVTINISKRHTSVKSCCESIKILVKFRHLKELIEKNDVHCVYSISTMPQSKEDEESDISRKADKLSPIADQWPIENKEFKVHGQILISTSDSGEGKEFFQLCKKNEHNIRLLFEDAGLLLKSIEKGCTKFSFEDPESADGAKVLLRVHEVLQELRDGMISWTTTSANSRIKVEASPNVTFNYTDNSTNHYGDNILGRTDEQRSAMYPDSSFKEDVDLHSNITLKTPDESVGSKIFAELFEMKEISKIPFELVNNVADHKEVKVIIMNKFRSSKECCESIDLLIEYHHLKKLIDKNGVHRVYWMSTIPPLQRQNKLPIIKKVVGCQSTVSHCRKTDEGEGCIRIHYGPSTIEGPRITIGGDCQNVSSGNDNSGPMNAYVTQEQGQRIG